MASLILNVTSKAKIFSGFQCFLISLLKEGFKTKWIWIFFWLKVCWSLKWEGQRWWKIMIFFSWSKSQAGCVMIMYNFFLCSRDFIPQWSSLESYNYAGIKHLRMVFICHYIFIEFLVSWVGPLPERDNLGVVFCAFFSGYEWLTSSSKGYFSKVANAR